MWRYKCKLSFLAFFMCVVYVVKKSLRQDSNSLNAKFDGETDRHRITFEFIVLIYILLQVGSGLVLSQYAYPVVIYFKNKPVFRLYLKKLISSFIMN